MDPGARLDLDRRRRLGMVEAIWGEHKTPRQIAAIIEELGRAGELALVTRVDAVKVMAVAELLGQALETGHTNDRSTCQSTEQSTAQNAGQTNSQADGLRHHPEAFCLTVGALPDLDPALGRVTVLAGGSSDLTVAAEAQLALQCHGVACDLVLDVGVAGLHRLLGQLEALRQARVLIACAGMEGALPTVLAGLMPQPVIGVPVSVGYGVSAGGHAALQGMLASCAPGLTVVNIDNGYGAAMAALRILAVPRP